MGRAVTAAAPNWELWSSSCGRREQASGGCGGESDEGPCVPERQGEGEEREMVGRGAATLLKKERQRRKGQVYQQVYQRIIHYVRS